jgi:hypothetical protein
MFSKADLKQITQKGITEESIHDQIKTFEQGIDFVELKAAVTPENGIIITDATKRATYIQLFEDRIKEYQSVRFTPASGAASRMFKKMFEAVEFLENADSDFDEFIEKYEEVFNLVQNLEKYPFIEDLKVYVEDILIEDNQKQEVKEIINAIISKPGLNYGNLPKGLLKFHNYKGISRTAFEEHFVEAFLYLKNKDNQIRLHFTVSPEHRILFEDLSVYLVANFKHIAEFVVSFSEQKLSTDTIAVNMDNTPFRNEKGELLFRPGGHGALLENLNDLEEDIVFIGNIDNIAPDRLKSVRVEFKKLLGGILLDKVDIVHAILRKIDEGNREEGFKNEILEILNDISPEMAKETEESEGDEFFLQAFEKLNRPVRVCGMVRNVGEPGGGPFWIKSRDGKISKQIVESSQINLSSDKQKSIFNSATHFNPVDLACFIKDYKGGGFNLLEFRDPDMAFISKKSQGGKNLKALELPGLWNGSMAGWLSWFVDVPIDTFTPVKTIFDLVRKEHLS